MQQLDLAKPPATMVAPSSWADSLRNTLDRWATHPLAYRWALSNPLTRWLVLRKTRQIFGLMSGFVHTQVLLACVRLHLFTLLQKAPATLEELAARTQTPAAALQRLVLSAVALGLLERRSRQRFGLGPLGAPLAVHEGLRAMVEHNNLLYTDMGDPTTFLRDAWSGQMAAYWPYAHAAGNGAMQQADAAQVARYSELMAASQTFVIEELLRSIAFEPYRCVLDVGAGKGRFVAELSRRAPHLQFQLFDLPPVLQLAQQHHATLGVRAPVAYHPGSFLHDELPQGADLVTLVRVAHDHPDDAVRTILRKVFAVLPVGGTLVLAEPMASEACEREVSDAYFHFYLLAMGAGRLRTPTELTRLLQDSGFVHVEQVPNAMPIHTRILIARKPGVRVLS